MSCLAGLACCHTVGHDAFVALERRLYRRRYPTLGSSSVCSLQGYTDQSTGKTRKFPAILGEFGSFLDPKVNSAGEFAVRTATPCPTRGFQDCSTTRVLLLSEALPCLTRSPFHRYLLAGTCGAFQDPSPCSGTFSAYLSSSCPPSVLPLSGGLLNGLFYKTPDGPMSSCCACRRWTASAPTP